MMNDDALSRLALAAAADAVIVADVAGVIRLWNSGAETVFGFIAAEAVGQSLDLVIPERLREAHWTGYRRAVDTGVMRLGGRATLTRGTHKSGRKLYVEMSFALVRDATGVVIGSIAIARDVTERHERERAAVRPTSG